MKKIICIILIAAFALLFSVNAYFIFNYYEQAEEQTKIYDNLASIVESNADIEKNIEPTDSIPYSEKTILPELAELYSQNNDLVGWIRIEDTNINYPVVQSKNSPNFYLKHGFDKGYTDYGCPYAQENCDIQAHSDNIIIYGHHMKNGSMFADLDKFKNRDFWKEHKTISFKTLTDRYEYEVVAVFKTVVYTETSNSFKYYSFVDSETPEDFAAFIETCKELSFYDTGVSSEYGDKLITLSTCEYSHITNSRLVVVAKQISPSGYEVPSHET